VATGSALCRQSYKTSNKGFEKLQILQQAKAYTSSKHLEKEDKY
jgi:hypothetical protein